MRKTLLSTSLAGLTGLVAILNSGCATDGEGNNWGAALLEVGSAALQIHGATNPKITQEQRVKSMVVGNTLHNLAVMENRKQSARIGKTSVVINQPQPTYQVPYNPPRYEQPIKYETKQTVESKDPIVRNLQKLKELKEAGIFTEEEYQIKRKNIIENAYQ